MSFRKAFIVGLAIGLVAAPLAASAQQPAKVPRVGYIGSVGPTVGAPILEAFRQGLRDLGYVEGQNIAIESRWAEGRVERFPDLAAELVRLKLDVFVVTSTPGALAAKQATSTIPIVMLAVDDPVGVGLVASLARPGGNVTGLTNFAVALRAKSLELLKEVVPEVTRVAVLSEPAYVLHATYMRETEVAAQALAVKLQLLGVRSANELESAFAAIVRDRAGALLVMPTPLTVEHARRIVGLAGKSRLPAIYAFRRHVEDGGLMSYGTSSLDQNRRAATYVDKILKGAKPADLPVEQPTRFELVINLKTAKALGLTFPQSILIRADQVIQ